MSKYKAVILGCGGRARAHAQAYQYNTNVQLVACCDMDADRLNVFTEAFGIKGYKDLTEMIQTEKPDIVHLVTPPNLRLQLMQQVSDLGVAGCVVEKPIALGVSDYLAISELTAKSKTKFVVNHQFRYHKHLQACRAALESGDLGNILFMEASARMNINNQGTHILDYIMSLNGDSRVASVFGSASGIDKQDLRHPAPETTFAKIVFANGVNATWNTGTTAPKTVEDDAIYKHCREAVYAEKGRTLYEEFNKWEIVAPDRTESGDSTGEDYRELNDRSQAQLVETLAAWLGDPAAISESNVEVALHQWNVVLGVYASALWRKPVQIPFAPPLDLFDQLKKALEA